MLTEKLQRERQEFWDRLEREYQEALDRDQANQGWRMLGAVLAILSGIFVGAVAFALWYMR
jgi:hypothetical protein